MAQLGRTSGQRDFAVGAPSLLSISDQGAVYLLDLGLPVGLPRSGATFPGVIQGTVRDVDGNPVRGVEVALFGSEAVEQRDRVKIDPDGRYPALNQIERSSATTPICTLQSAICDFMRQKACPRLMWRA